MARLDYDELNNTIRYLMFSVFTVRPADPPTDRDGAAAEFVAFLDDITRDGWSCAASTTSRACGVTPTS